MVSAVNGCGSLFVEALLRPVGVVGVDPVGAGHDFDRPGAVGVSLSVSYHPARAYTRISRRVQSVTEHPDNVIPGWIVTSSEVPPVGTSDALGDDGAFVGVYG